MAKNAYSVLHPRFLKVVRTINTSETIEHIYASQKLIDNFLNFIDKQEKIGILPLGINRKVLSTYYGQELHRLVQDQVITISRLK